MTQDLGVGMRRIGDLDDGIWALDEEQVFRATGLPETVLLAGLDYVLEDRVTNCLAQTDALAGTVDGHTGEYRVEVRTGQPPASRCECKAPTFCRHAAAVLLTWARDRERFVVLDSADLPSQGLKEALFQMAAGDPEPLASLRGAPGRAASTELRATALTNAFETAEEEGPHALLGFVHHVCCTESGPFDAPSARIIGQAFKAAIAVPPNAFLDLETTEGLLKRYGMGMGRRDLDSELRRLLLAATPSRLGDFLWALTATAVWQARVDLSHNSSDHDANARAGRAVSLLLDLAERQGGTEALLQTAAEHASLPGVGERRARTLATLGRLDEAAQVAEGAYLHATGREAMALYHLLITFARRGISGVRGFLLAIWEAQPTAEGLAALRDLGTNEERRAFCQAAVTTLARHRRHDLLTTWYLLEDHPLAAAREAMRAGPHAVDTAGCAALAHRLADSEPLTAVHLYGAAFRRCEDPAERRLLVRRARALVEGGKLGEWNEVRRRHFPEGLAARRRTR